MNQNKQTQKTTESRGERTRKEQKHERKSNTTKE